MTVSYLRIRWIAALTGSGHRCRPECLQRPVHSHHAGADCNGDAYAYTHSCKRRHT